MNYPYTLQIEEHFLHKTKTAQELVAALTDQLMMYRDCTNQAMMNMLDSHDTARLLTLAGENKALALQTLTFMFMQTGSPCIYYGTEMGMTGGEDPDCRKPMDWQKKGTPFWHEVQKLITFRNNHAATLGNGTISLSVTSTGLIKVKRIGAEKITALFNTTPDKIAVSTNGQVVLSQNFADGQLAEHGFIIELAN